MQLTDALRFVQKPSRYLPFEIHPIPLNPDGERLALIYNGRYEEALSSYLFQVVLNLFDTSSAFLPRRFAVPDRDMVELMLTDAEIPWQSLDDETSLQDAAAIWVFSEHPNTIDIHRLWQHHQVPPAQRWIQSDIHVHPGSSQMAESVLRLTNPMCLKAELSKASSVADLKLSAPFEDRSTESIFGAASKFIRPFIPVNDQRSVHQHLHAIYQRNDAAIFTNGIKTDAVTTQAMKKLQQQIQITPAENELHLFPLGLSNRLRQLDRLHPTYYELTPTVKKVLADGWRIIHLHFWIGHPLQDGDDFREFKRELQAIDEFVQQFKKIQIHLTFSIFCPPADSIYRWDEILTPKAVQQAIRGIEKLVADRPNFSVHVENVEDHIMRIVSRRSDIECVGVVDGAPQVATIDELCQGQAMDEIGGRAWVEVDGDHLRSQRLDVSKRLAEPIPPEPGELNLKLIRTAPMNLNIRKSKTLDNAAQSIASEEMTYGRTVKRRAAQQSEITRKYRIRFEKRDRFAFFGAPDIRRVILHMFEQAKCPVKMSKGFTPLPKIAFSAPSSAGVISDVEYMDVEFVTIKPIDFEADVNPLMPNGLALLEWREIHPKTASLASRIDRIGYRFEFDGLNVLQHGLHDALLKPDVFVERAVKSGTLRLSLADYVESVETDAESLTIVFKVVDQKWIRTEEFLAVLKPLLNYDPYRVQIIKTGQWIRGDRGDLMSPMEHV